MGNLDKKMILAFLHSVSDSVTAPAGVSRSNRHRWL